MIYLIIYIIGLIIAFIYFTNIWGSIINSEIAPNAWNLSSEENGPAALFVLGLWFITFPGVLITRIFAPKSISKKIETSRKNLKENDSYKIGDWKS
jgi:hypothetical protein